ncbi:probable 28S ribosomal protein S6, mitochondrial [Dreissena polymorpha]|uniref:Small ribosomal subunit protein bS6m n=1 Tax=Dreissena polymorpha TaxID=45954 RepID=A0A9D4D179_DREPO|nr:probable 28S ribosomal protein S6, mitochondrial [Dreissena polymorpha]KAH3736272.1 hypothetical protein DPMN_042835 [Dreissena polymorpha]
MPAYEASIILKNFAQREIMKDVLKAACRIVYSEDGVVRKMENLGVRELPHPMRVQRRRVTHGHYFLLQFDSSVEGMRNLEKKYKNTAEIMKFGIIKREEEPRRPCLDGPCLFGELAHPEHERTAYKRKVLRNFNNRTVKS